LGKRKEEKLIGGLYAGKRNSQTQDYENDHWLRPKSGVEANP